MPDEGDHNGLSRSGGATADFEDYNAFESVGMGYVAAALRQSGARVETDPQVRELLQSIIEDEDRHVELAWKTLRWALETGGEPVRRAIGNAFAFTEAPRLKDHPAAIAAYGLPDRETLASRLEQTWQRVIALAGPLLTS